MEKYHDNHSLCPVCRGSMIETTTMGWFGEINPNRATCCGCGWKGMEEELNPKIKSSCFKGVNNGNYISS